jgi:hypothetical protein
MGKQNYAMNGTIGSMIFYKYNGVPVVRSKPSFVRQTKATKQCSQDFGKAVSFSKELRDSIEKLTHVSRDRSLMYRMNKALYQWIRESKNDDSLLAEKITLLNNLQLNQAVPDKRKISFSPEVDFEKPGVIVVTIPPLQPAKDIVCPESTDTIELVIVAARCNTEPVQTRAYLPLSEKKILLDYKTTYNEQTVELPLPTFPKDIVIVAIGLNFIVRTSFSEYIVFDKEWVPGKIVGVKFRS